MGKVLATSDFRKIVLQTLFSYNMTRDVAYFHHAITEGWGYYLVPCITFLPPSEVPVDKKVSDICHYVLLPLFWYLGIMM